jgi:hypothetical protein
MACSTGLQLPTLLARYIRMGTNLLKMDAPVAKKAPKKKNMDGADGADDGSIA